MKNKIITNKVIYALLILFGQQCVYPAARNMSVSGFGTVSRISTPFHVVAPKATPAAPESYAYPTVYNNSNAPIEVKIGEIYAYADSPEAAPSLHDYRVSIMIPAHSQMMMPLKKFYINEEVFNSNVCIDSEGRITQCR